MREKIRMETLHITAEIRQDEKSDALRAEGRIPAVVYGLNKEPLSIIVLRNDFDKAFEQAGESTVIKVDVNGAEETVLIQDYQIDPITDFTTHADFLRVDMNKPVETAISLEFIGESAAVKTLGGTLVQQIDEIEVKALPSALVRSIEVDISALATFDDAIHVSDLTIPEGIEVKSDAETVVALVQEPRSQEEMDALDEDVEMDVDAVEVSTEKKEEEDESEEA
jgi:large subunit ribosomal protein L25